MSFNDSGCVNTTTSFYPPTTQSDDVIKKEDIINFDFSTFSLDENNSSPSDHKDKRSNELSGQNELKFNIDPFLDSIPDLGFNSEDSNAESSFVSKNASYADYKMPTSPNSFELSSDAINNLLLKQQRFQKQPQQVFKNQINPSAFSTPKHTLQAFNRKPTKIPSLQSSNVKQARNCDTNCYSGSFLTKRFLNDVAYTNNSNNDSIDSAFVPNSESNLVFENKSIQFHQFDTCSFQPHLSSATKSFNTSHSYSPLCDEKATNSFFQQVIFNFKRETQYQQQLRMLQQQQQHQQQQHQPQHQPQHQQQQPRDDFLSQQAKEVFSKKVFIGGLPPDIDEGL